MLHISYMKIFVTRSYGLLDLHGHNIAIYQEYDDTLVNAVYRWMYSWQQSAVYWSTDETPESYLD